MVKHSNDTIPNLPKSHYPVTILGNSIVLVGSLFYKAIDMDRIDLIFVENLAFADLMLAGLYIVVFDF